MNIPINLLEFKIEDQLFGVDGDKIEQILRAPPITSIPLSDNSLKGVTVLNGKIVSVFDMGLILGLNEIDLTKDSARLLTVNYDDTDYAILVDEVLDMSTIIEKNYESIEDKDEKIVGFYKKDENVCQVLSIELLIKSVSMESYIPQKLENISIDKEDDSTLSSSDNFDRLLFFKLAHEKFAINIASLRELIFIPKVITPIPESEDFILGMITLRDEVIVAIDLRKVFGFKGGDINEKSRFLIIQDDSKSLALLVDFVDEVRDIEFSNIEMLPSQFKDTKIEGICKEKDEITSKISPIYLKEMISRYFIEEDGAVNNDSKIKEDTDMSEMAVFSISNEEFSIDIKDVQEIIRYEDITKIPEAPQFVDGIINLRGVIIPIVSLPERLGFEKNITDRTKILVCLIDDYKIGFLVDDVNEILFVEDKYISRSDSDNSLFSEVVNLDDGKRVILKLKASSILSEDTLENIKMINKEGE